MKIPKMQKWEPDWRKKSYFFYLLITFKKNVSSNLCGLEAFWIIVWRL